MCTTIRYIPAIMLQTYPRIIDLQVIEGIKSVSEQVILEANGLTIGFKGCPAVDRVSLKIQSDHLHALISSNGGGKTTENALLLQAFGINLPGLLSGLVWL